MEQKDGAILWKIYFLESGLGDNDVCRKKGKGYAGFGVMDNGDVVCYPTFETAVVRAQYWWGQLYPAKTLVDALCTWNQGCQKTKRADGKEVCLTDDEGKLIPWANCNYYQTYLAL